MRIGNPCGSPRSFSQRAAANRRAGVVTWALSRKECNRSITCSKLTPSGRRSALRQSSAARRAKATSAIRGSAPCAHSQSPLVSREPTICRKAADSAVRTAPPRVSPPAAGREISWSLSASRGAGPKTSSLSSFQKRGPLTLLSPSSRCVLGDEAAEGTRNPRASSCRFTPAASASSANSNAR